MLDLNRKPGEAMVVNHRLEVRVVEVRPKTVEAGFTSPRDATVVRAEVFASIRDADGAAAEAVRSLPEAVPPDRGSRGE